jgi:type II secretory pathway pseudopilin PulG
MRSEQGMTLIEASIILAVVATLSAMLAPSINGYVEQARQARTRNDVRVIGEAILTFIDDNAEHQFLQVGKGGVNGFPEEPPDHADANRVELLVSDGDIPTLGSGVSGETFWTRAVNLTTVDTLANHLGQNTPGDDCSGCAGEFGDTSYRNPIDISVGGGGSNIDFARTESGGFNAPYSWRGPYLRGPVGADPWGNRYAVNVAFLDPAPNAVSPVTVSNITAGFTTADYPRLDVFVISAGPDEEIDTKSAQDGAVPGDNDFIFVVSSHAK